MLTGWLRVGSCRLRARRQRHDLENLINVFEEYKDYNGPVLVHVITKKGKGYSPAENKPIWSHGVTPFDIVSGEVKKSDKPAPPSYSCSRR